MKLKWLKDKNIDIKYVDKTNFYRELEKILSIDEVDKLYKEMAKNIFVKEVLDKTEPVNKAIESIIELSKKYDIYIITARTNEMINSVEKWLEKHSIKQYIKTVISSSYESKQDICLKNNIEFLCDDDERHLCDNKVPIKVLFNKRKIIGKEGAFATESWEDVVKYLRRKS